MVDFLNINGKSKRKRHYLMIRTRKDLQFYLNEDRNRNGVPPYFGGAFLRRLVGSEQARVFHYLYCLRHCEYHLNNKESLWHRFMYMVYKVRLSRLGCRYGISIHLNSCGYGLRIMHLSGGGGVLINAIKVGNYCGFNSGVLIGNNDGEANRPTLGDYVAFGPGAKAFGKITIGNNVFVAANSVVTKDVPNNCIVGGIPAKIIKTKETK